MVILQKIDMEKILLLVQCGAIIGVGELFDVLLLVGDVVQWTAMLLGYTEQDKNEDGIQVYLQMLVQGLLSNDEIFWYVESMWQHGDIQKGNNVHAQMSWRNMEVIETSALIEMYAKCGSMLEAQQIFAIRQARSLIEWMHLISGYACTENI